MIETATWSLLFAGVCALAGAVVGAMLGWRRTARRQQAAGPNLTVEILRTMLDAQTAVLRQGFTTGGPAMSAVADRPVDGHPSAVSTETVGAGAADPADRLARQVEQMLNAHAAALATLQRDRDQQLLAMHGRWLTEQAHRQAEQALASEAAHRQMRAAHLEAMLQERNSAPARSAPLTVPLAPSGQAAVVPQTSAARTDVAPSPTPAGPSPVRSGSMSARPPELLLTPITRSDTAATPAAFERAWTDEELDALPPELPAPGPSRKRTLRAPAKPPLRNI